MNNLARQSIAFFKCDFRRGWRETLIFAGLLSCALLLEPEIPAIKPYVYGIAIWLTLLVAVAMTLSLLILRSIRYVGWLLHLWGHAKQSRKSWNEVLKEPFDEAVYRNFLNNLHASEQRDRAQFKDSMKFK